MTYFLDLFETIAQLTPDTILVCIMKGISYNISLNLQFVNHISLPIPQIHHSNQEVESLLSRQISRIKIKQRVFSGSRQENEK